MWKNILLHLRRLKWPAPLASSAQPDPSHLAREEELKARLRARCARFRRLLAANKRALEAMSRVDERLAQGRPFGMRQVRAAAQECTAAVQQMLDEYLALAEGRHARLHEALARITAQMDRVLAMTAPALQPAPDAVAMRGGLAELGPFILPLAQIRLQHVPQAGGKMANLGELAAGVGLDVPAGFAVTVAAYEYFMEYNELGRHVTQRLDAADMDSLDALFSLSAEVQQRIVAAPLPPDLKAAITQAVEGMRATAGEDLLLALRSSAVGEDALNAAFAGQYRSELNVPPDEACDVWKEIIASKYAVTALSYRYQRGIPDEAAPMAVGVLAMVRAAFGGVAYSRDPVAAARGQEQVVLNTVPGLPQAVVDGAATPDTYIFSRENPPRLLEKHLADHKAATSGQAALILDDAQALRLARVALALEEYYAEPQDVEWALAVAKPGQAAHEARIVILQSRPLRDAAPGPERRADQALNAAADQEKSAAAERAEARSGLKILASGGLSVSSGVGLGRVFVARKEADMLSFPQDGILVVERAQPRWATLLPRAAGLISESGGMAGHLASVAREYGLPAIFSLPGACDTLQGAGEVTLDAGCCQIFAGRQPQLLPQGVQAPHFMQGSPVYQRLEALAMLMTPLNLLDPDGSGFRPEACASLHDITRFCHEKAVRIMFDDEAGVSRSMGKQLKAGVKLHYWVLDMEGGFTTPVSGPVVDLSNIACAPMLALWEGMVAVPWAGPPATNAAGFMSVVLESAMNPDLDSTAPSVMSNKNYFIIAARYMVLQARYGYHYCTVECLADQLGEENFVSFQFKGGAADRERRRLRAQMVSELLEDYGFRTEVNDDGLFAVAEGFDGAQTLLRARLLGYLLIHTRQVDMVMKNQSQAEALHRKLAADMAAIVTRAG